MRKWYSNLTFIITKCKNTNTLIRLQTISKVNAWPVKKLKEWYKEPACKSLRNVLLSRTLFIEGGGGDLTAAERNVKSCLKKSTCDDFPLL